MITWPRWRWLSAAIVAVLATAVLSVTWESGTDDAGAAPLPVMALPQVQLRPTSPGDHASSIWLPYWDMGDAVRTVSGNSDVFHTASLFWYDASCARITPQAGAGDRAVIRRLRNAGLKVVVTVTGGGIGPRDAVRCFSDATSREKHIRLLVALARSRAYAGIDLDYENLALTARPDQARRVRAAYTRFVRELCPRIRRVAKTCTITVMSRTADQPAVVEGRLSPSVFDYTALSRTANRMRVMTYDQHTRYSEPGPIAGLPWVKQVIAYIRATTNESKVELGVPLYGRNWGTRSFSTLTGEEGTRLAARHGKTPRYDSTQREYTFSYSSGGERHRVWFAGPRSERERVLLALRSGLAGGAFWAAGQQQSGSWQALRR